MSHDYFILVLMKMTVIKPLLLYLAVFFTLLPISAYSAVDDCSDGTGGIVTIEGTPYTSDSECTAAISIRFSSISVTNELSVIASAPIVSMQGPFAIGKGSKFSVKTIPTTASIQFVGDQSAIFDQSDQQAHFEAYVVDSKGDEIPGTALTWALSDNSNVELFSSDEHHASVRSTGTLLSSFHRQEAVRGRSRPLFP